MPRIVPPIDESGALLAEKAGLAHLPIPDPLGGGRMHNMVNAIALYRERVQGERLIEGWTEGPAAEGAWLVRRDCLTSDMPEESIRDLLTRRYTAVDAALAFLRTLRRSGKAALWSA